MKSPQPKLKPYRFEMVLNGTKIKGQADTLENAIMTKKPDFVLTEMYFKVSKEKDVRERKLNLVQGRKLFADEAFRSIFINNLMLA